MVPILMKPIIPFLLATVLASPLWAVDFTPRYREVTISSGQVAKRLFFQGETGKYTLFAPQDTNMDGESNALRFTFDTLESSTLVFQRSTLNPEVEFGNEQYLREVERLLPATASEVTLIEEGANPLANPDWKGHRYLFSCKLPGNNLRVEVLFVNLNTKEQIVIITTAYSEVFKSAREAASRIIRSWSPVTEEELSIPPLS